MAITLPDLPYARDALAPHISAETLDFHHGKHHRTYVDKANELVKGTPLDSEALETIIRAAWTDKNAALFNNAAQIWNHSFYWRSMKPGGGGRPTGKLAEAIGRDFGSFEKFADAFKAAGAGQFGSGWAWLVVKNGKLDVRKTGNAETPLTEDGVTPLLTMDVWEHAYYLDFQNRRPDYITAFLEHLVNWDFAADNFAKA
ncbi:superoxide dismutase [Alkalicaulis satelles]|uniref:Superoxide dismutase n=1 Tax=Alkalicaulis satelles TaxID=2609175 RepID=A0A5M6ZNS1_9PROT|nr:superoxide dismutase [Alkalicaulis satelles]KAA5805224.1 superoxide dismutase [Alkalicaulis satelles]